MEKQFEAVAARGNFTIPRLQDILTVARGVIDAAYIYYGGTPRVTRAATKPMSHSEAEKAMKDGMDKLEKLMQVEKVK